MQRSRSVICYLLLSFNGAYLGVRRLLLGDVAIRRGPVVLRGSGQSLGFFGSTLYLSECGQTEAGISRLSCYFHATIV